MVGVHTGIANAALEVIAVDPGVEVAVHNIVRIGLGNHLLVAFYRAGLFGGNKCRADIGKVRAHGLGRQNCTTRRNSAGKCHRAAKPLPDFGHHGKWAFDAGMATGARRYGDQAIGAFFYGLVGKHIVDHVVQYHTAPGLHSAVDVLACAQAGNHDGHFIFFADLHIVVQAVIAFVHDLVDGKRCGRRLRVGFVVRGKRLGNFGQPFVQLGGWPRIQGGHRADHPRFALGDHQLGVADDEKG